MYIYYILLIYICLSQKIRSYISRLLHKHLGMFLSINLKKSKEKKRKHKQAHIYKKKNNGVTEF